MTFDEYLVEIEAAIDKWADAVRNSSRSRAHDLKEDGENLIQGCIESFPHRKAEIRKFVSFACARRFD